MVVPDNKIWQIAQAIMKTAWPTLIDNKVFYCGEGNNLAFFFFWEVFGNFWACPTWPGCPGYLCSVEPPARSACRRSAIAAPGRLLHDWLWQQTLALSAAPSPDPGAVLKQLCSRPAGPMFAEWKGEPTVLTLSLNQVPCDNLLTSHFRTNIWRDSMDQLWRKVEEMVG